MESVGVVNAPVHGVRRCSPMLCAQGQRAAQQQGDGGCLWTDIFIIAFCTLETDLLPHAGEAQEQEDDQGQRGRVDHRVHGHGAAAQ